MRIRRRGPDRGRLFLPLFTGFRSGGFWRGVKRLTLKSYNVTKWLALGSTLSAIGLLVYTGHEVSVVRRVHLVQLRISGCDVPQRAANVLALRYCHDK